MTTPTLYVPLTDVLAEAGVPSVITDILSSVADQIAYADGYFVGDADAGVVYVKVDVIDELAIGLPILPDLAVVLGGGPVEVQVEFSEGHFDIYLNIVVLKLRFPRAWLQPVVADPSGRFAADPDPTHFFQIPFPFGLHITDGMAIEPVWPQAALGTFSLPRAMIGDSGVIIEADDIVFRFSKNMPLPPGGQALGDDWQGIFIAKAAVHLPDVSFLPTDLQFTNCYLDSSGFTGSVAFEDSTVKWDETQKQYVGHMAGDLFGFKCGLRKVEISFLRNSLTKGSLLGEAFVPYVDKRLGIELKASMSGDFSVGLAGPQTANPDPGVTVQSDGLLKLHTDGVLDATLESLTFAKQSDGGSVRLSGKIRPLFASIDWPEIDLKALTVHSDGRVEIEGGWLDLSAQKAASLFGFPLEIRKVGFGTDNGRRWVGFSGGVKLVDGIPVGGSVEGLRLLWDSSNNIDFDLKGIGVDLKIPDVLTLHGKVAFFREATPERQYFQGGANVTIDPLNCSLDAQLLIGKTPQYTFFYIFLEAGLPAGIPLFGTGLAIYGMGGLFGYNVRPDRRSGEPWYEGWYKRAPIGPTDSSKWVGDESRQAFGGSLTLGTMPDNGHALNARVLVIVLVPGPTILLEGKANIIKDRREIADAKAEPLFRALAVLDQQAGTLLVNIEPHYKYPADASVIDIQGNAEAFFDFNRSDRWYVHLGVKDPREKRIQAKILKLFQANAYLMLNQPELALGAFVGIDKHYSFGPLGVGLGVWFEAGAEIVLRPLQLAADAGIHGKADLKAFGFGIGLNLDADAHLKTPTPYDFNTVLHGKADLPWPLPDAEFSVPFAYHEDAAPPLTVPVQNVEVMSRKCSESWDVGKKSSDPLLVPIDGNPVIVFSKSVHDNAGVGGNVQVAHSEQVGGVTVDYHLDSIQLEKLVGGSWIAAAGRPQPTNGTELYGMWVPMTTQGDTPPSTKLALFTKTPFDALRNSATAAAAEEFADHYPEYPCVSVCGDFEQVPLGTVVQSGFFLPVDQRGSLVYGLTFEYSLSGHPGRPLPKVRDPRAPLGGHLSNWPQTHTLSLPDFDQTPLRITLPEPADWVRLRFSTGFFADVKPYMDGQRHVTPLLSGVQIVYYTGSQAGSQQRFTQSGGIEDFEVILNDHDITAVEIDGAEIDVYEVCYIAKASTLGASSNPCSSSHTASEAKRWADDEFLFDPQSEYRIRISTRVARSAALDPAGGTLDTDAGVLGPGTVTPATTGASQYAFEHEVYFKTEGPPGFVGADLDRRLKPVGTGQPTQSLLRTLQQYVAFTVPSDGERPVYRAYDVAVHFNDSYVQRMYDMFGNHSLTLTLLDRNGNPPKAASAASTLRSVLPAPTRRAASTGTSSESESTTWDKEQDAKPDAGLTREDKQWKNLLEDATCDIPLESKPKNDVLQVSLAGFSPTDPTLSGTVLQPEMTYRATLVAVDSAGQPDPSGPNPTLYSFGFTTSKFATFAHQIHSFDGRLWDSDQGRDAPLPALTAAQQATLRAAAQNATAGDFDTIATLFQFGHREFPDMLEVTLLHDGSTRWGFLVESHEPLDAQRVDASVWKSQLQTLPARHTGSVRLKNVVFGDHSGTDYNTETVDLLVTDFVDVGSFSLEHLASSADRTTFNSVYAFPQPRPRQPGTIFRLHAGIEPTSPPVGDCVEHIYLTAAGGTPAWIVNQPDDILQLRDNIARVISLHEFLSQWSPLAATWVWNADRTRAFVFPNDVLSAQPLASGTYRFEWRFALDQSASHPSLPILRCRGSSDPESAVTQFSVT